MIKTDEKQPVKKYLRLKEAAQFLGMSYKTARNKWPSWGIPVYKIGRNPLFEASDLERMVKAHRIN